MLRDVKSYVASCATCQRKKGTPHTTPLAAAPAGYRYILVLIDNLTRFLQLIPVPSKEA